MAPVEGKNPAKVPPPAVLLAGGASRQSLISVSSSRRTESGEASGCRGGESGSPVASICGSDIDHPLEDAVTFATILQERGWLRVNQPNCIEESGPKPRSTAPRGDRASLQGR